MRVLAVDPGSRRVGLAISEEGGVVLPVRTVEREGAGDEKTAAAVASEAERAGVGEIVVGLPMQLDGTEGKAAARARALGEAIARASKLPVVYWDERWTTTIAERNLRHVKGGARERRRVIDQAAAVLLLESYLESKANRTWNDAQVDQVVDAQAAAAARGKRVRRGPKRSRGR